MGALTRFRNVGSGDITAYYADGSNANFSLESIKSYLQGFVIQPRFRLGVLNSDETMNYYIPEDDILSGGSYNENYQNGQRRTLSLTLFNEMGDYTPSINGLWANKKFSFEMGFEINSDLSIWFSKGVYVLNNISPSHEPSQKKVNVELGDKFSILEGKQATLSTTYTIEPNQLIEEIIQNILSTDKGNGEVLDPKPFIYHSSFKGKKTQASITKEAGETYGSIILDLATQLSAEVFYDQMGQLNFVPLIEVTTDQDKPIIYSFVADDGDLFNLNLDFDLTDIVNRVFVIGNNINGGYCQAEAVNQEASSPLCVQRIGYYTGSPIKDSNITTLYLAQERADYELRKQLILKSSGSFSTSLSPLLTVNNLVNITDSYYNLQEEKFIIQSISFNIDNSGKMDITAANIKNLPFLVQ